MKNLFAATASCALLLALGVFVHHRLSSSLQDGTPAVRPAAKAPAVLPVESPDNANRLPPTGAAGYAMVNEQRLRRLQADRGYKGPSFRENYEAPLKMRLSGEKKPSTRIPAGQ